MKFIGNCHCNPTFGAHQEKTYSILFFFLKDIASISSTIPSLPAANPSHSHCLEMAHLPHPERPLAILSRGSTSENADSTQQGKVGLMADGRMSLALQQCLRPNRFICSLCYPLTIAKLEVKSPKLHYSKSPK